MALLSQGTPKPQRSRIVGAMVSGEPILKRPRGRRQSYRQAHHHERYSEHQPLHSTFAQMVLRRLSRAIFESVSAAVDRSPVGRDAQSGVRIVHAMFRDHREDGLGLGPTVALPLTGVALLGRPFLVAARTPHHRATYHDLAAGRWSMPRRILKARAPRKSHQARHNAQIQPARTCRG
jgi:hypothetical protein